MSVASPERTLGRAGTSGVTPGSSFYATGISPKGPPYNHEDIHRLMLSGHGRQGSCEDGGDTEEEEGTLDRSPRRARKAILLEPSDVGDAVGDAADASSPKRDDRDDGIRSADAGRCRVKKVQDAERGSRRRGDERDKVERDEEEM